MAVKTTQIDPGLDPVFNDPVQAAEQVVEQVLGDAADRVEIAWGPGSVTSEGEPTARIRMTYDGVTRTTDFTSWDLEDELLSRRSLRRVWSDLLSERGRIQWQRVLDSLAKSSED